MRWTHLPMDGGLYNQNPGLIDRFWYIFSERSKEQAKEAAREKAKNNKGMGRSHKGMGARGGP